MLEQLAVHDDEAVVATVDEVFRLPLAPSGTARAAVLVRALPELRSRLPVAVAVPRFVGVMPDGQTPFTAEQRLPGTAVAELSRIALGQLAGVVAALQAVPAREARQWGVSGDGEVLVHGALSRRALLADAQRGVLTGLTGWRLRLATEADSVDAELRPLLG